MFERFTDKARQVVFLAKGKATERGDDQIRPVHMLYGLAAADGIAARVLTAVGVDAAAVDRELGRAGGAPPGALPSGNEADGGDAAALAAIGIDLDEIKRRIEDSFGPGALQRVPLTPRGPLNWTGRLPLNDQAKLSLALSLREARALHHNYIGTEHLLLGLLRVADRYPRGDFAAVTLRDLGLDPASLRTRVLDELRQLQALRARAQPAKSSPRAGATSR
jgi:ATP-dependent Clp protease ATP-binding subunit ClpA